MLSIALDASLWDEPTTGIGLYTRCLARALEAEGVRVRLLGARVSGDNPRRGLGRTAYALGRLPSVLAAGEEPLYHAVCNFNLPLLRVPDRRTVLTVHDIIPLALPETVSLPYRWQSRLWLARSLLVADQLVCDSEHTRRDLLAHFGPVADKAQVIHLGVDHVDAVPTPDAVGEAFLQSLALPADFVLYAGALDARKNVELVLDALVLLRQQGRPATLVLAGQSWYGAGPVEKRLALLRADGFDIRPLGYQPSELLYALMRRAAVFVFPSRYEGFGLPPLEAMHLGVPAIISTASALPEVCGEAAVQVDPADAGALAAAMDRLLRSPEERAHRRELGRRWTSRFTWQRTAKKTLEVYRAALV